MANEQNLKPITSLSSEEAKKRGSAGGKASVEARREKKLFKEEILKRMGEDDWNEMIDKLIARAKNTDKAFEVLRDTVGQKPKEEVEAKITKSYEDYIKEVEDEEEY